MRAATMVAAVLLALGLWELGCWVWPVRHVMDNPWYTTTGAAATVGSRDLPFERPPHFTWTGLSRGDLATLHGRRDPHARVVTFQTDFQGFRNSRDITEADIVFIGDSYTEAGNVPEEESFVQLVGSKLGRTVRNLGRAVYAPPHELVVLQKYGLACKPKLVIWQIAESNDLKESRIFEKWQQAGKPFIDFDDERGSSRGASWRSRSPTYRLLSLFRDVDPWPLQGMFRDASGTEYPIWFLASEPSGDQNPVRNPGTPLFGESIKQGVELLKSRGIDVLVVLIPMKVAVMGHYVRFTRIPSPGPKSWTLPEMGSLSYHLALYCKELDVPLLDTTEPFRQHTAAGELLFQPRDTHLNTRGHEVLAELIAEAIETMERASP